MLVTPGSERVNGQSRKTPLHRRFLLCNSMQFFCTEVATSKSCM